MGMNIGQRPDADEPEVMIEMNATPLIDVMMVLLIMLIITIPVQLHSVNMDVPLPVREPPRVEPVVYRLDVDATGGIRLNGQPVTGRQELDARLREAAQLPQQPEIHVRAHPRARYEEVAAVLASAQRNGLMKLGVVGMEQFAD